MDNTNDEETTNKLVSDAIKVLRQNFDYVQVFVGREIAGKVDAFHKGVGNYYARYGQIKLWTVTMEAMELEGYTIPEEDDGDEEEC